MFAPGLNGTVRLLNCFGLNGDHHEKGVRIGLWEVEHGCCLPARALVGLAFRFVSFEVGIQFAQVLGVSPR